MDPQNKHNATFQFKFQRKNSFPGVISRTEFATKTMLWFVFDLVKGFAFTLQFLTFGLFTAYAYHEFLAFKRRSLLRELVGSIIPIFIKYGIVEKISEPKLEKTVSSNYKSHHHHQ